MILRTSLAASLGVEKQKSRPEGSCLPLAVPPATLPNKSSGHRHFSMSPPLQSGLGTALPAFPTEPRPSGRGFHGNVFSSTDHECPGVSNPAQVAHASTRAASTVVFVGRRHALPPIAMKSGAGFKRRFQSRDQRESVCAQWGRFPTCPPSMFSRVSTCLFLPPGERKHERNAPENAPLCVAASTGCPHLFRPDHSPRRFSFTSLPGRCRVDTRKGNPRNNRNVMSFF